MCAADVGAIMRGLITFTILFEASHSFRFEFFTEYCPHHHRYPVSALFMFTPESIILTPVWSKVRGGLSKGDGCLY